MKISNSLLVLIAVSALVCPQPSLREVNQVAKPQGTSVIAIVGANLIDGRGGPVVTDAVVVIHGDRIAAVGPGSSVKVPAGAEIVEGKGFTLVPGLIDAHFHIDVDDPLPVLSLSHGVASFPDPGQWIEAYDNARKASAPVPRLFP